VIKFDTFELENGLRVIHHFNPNKSSTVVNILYNVGARDEDPNKTGFAHLFEHLMFGGSKNIPDYDGPLQKAGGQNNAFTNNDITNYYIQIPSENIETAFWLESDRMKQLAFSEKSLSVQQGVVIEEFKQRYLNQPYGLAYKHLRELAYKTHPYQWQTIGKEISHVVEAKLIDVIEFFNKYYNPNNAIMCVAGNITLDNCKHLTTKWFSDIAKGERNKNIYSNEEIQVSARAIKAPQANAQKAIYIAFHKSKKMDVSHAVEDLLSDILSSGKNSFFYKYLIDKEKVFTSIDCFVGDDIDPGLFYIVGRLQDDILMEVAENKLWEYITIFKSSFSNENELLSRKNKLLTAKSYQDTELLNIAMQLCFAENLGDIQFVNNELLSYINVSVNDIKLLANKILIKEKSNTVYYDNIIK